MSRGNQGNAIFRDDDDRRLFLDTLEEACGRTGWRIHAYVLMGNHYHALLETPEANLVVGMKWLLGTYTRRFNSRHKVFGHLFQGRYKALIVDAGRDDYFQTVGTYIHLNPVRAGLVRPERMPLKSYAWSSFPAYAGRPSKRPAWLRVDRVLGSLRLQRDDARARRGYQAYLESRALETLQGVGESEAEWRAIRRGWYLGDERFRDRLKDLLEDALEGRRRQSFAGGAARAHDEAEAEKLLKAGTAALAMERRELKRMPKGADEKLALAWLLRTRTTVSRRWAAARLAMGDESRVTQGVAAVKSARRGRLRALRDLLESVGSHRADEDN